MTTKPQTASQRIIEEITSWPGVEAGPGARGEFSFKLGRREIGHLHGDYAAHFSFPKVVWAELRRQVGSRPTRSSQTQKGRLRAGSRARPTSAMSSN